MQTLFSFGGDDAEGATAVGGGVAGQFDVGTRRQAEVQRRRDAHLHP